MDDHHYPKLRVRRSWGPENQTSETVLTDNQTPDADSRKFVLLDDQTLDSDLRAFTSVDDQTLDANPRVCPLVDVQTSNADIRTSALVNDQAPDAEIRTFAEADDQTPNSDLTKLSLADDQMPVAGLRIALADDQTPATGPRTFTLADDQTVDFGLETCDTSQYSDENSIDDSDEQSPSLPDSEDNFLHNDTSARVSVSSPSHIATDPSSQWDKIEEHSTANSDDLYKEVRCIETEHSIIKKDIESNGLFPDRDRDTLALKVAGNEDGANQDSTSPQLKEDKELNCSQRTVVIPSLQDNSPWMLGDENCCYRSLKLARSRSCKAVFMSGFYSPWFEKEERGNYTPSNLFEKEFIGRPEGFQNKFLSFDYDTETAKLSRKGGLTAGVHSSVDQLKEQVVTASTDENVGGCTTFVARPKEMTKFQYEEQKADDQVSAFLFVTSSL